MSATISTAALHVGMCLMCTQISEQDESLGILESSIQRLGKLSLNISNEIKEQNKMLDRMVYPYSVTSAVLSLLLCRMRM